MKKILFLFILHIYIIPVISNDTIYVTIDTSGHTYNIQNAIEQTKKRNGKPTVIKLQQGNYLLYRESAPQALYHVSNTTTISTNPNPIKHIGLWLKELKNVTIDGNNSLLITHGKLTSFVIDGCEDVVLKNFRVTADDPTVVEIKVIETGENFLIVSPHSSASYEINENNKLSWIGHGWKFDGGIAQIYNPETNYSLRCTSPMDGLKSVKVLDGGLLRFNYDKVPPKAEKGDIFQLRDGLRDEVAGFILKSKNIILENITFHFLGNFGIVGQYSENITYDKLICEPELASGRTCAGFADFVQMSGCKGDIKITNCRFEGAQDDPINIHGTHLAVSAYHGDKEITVKFSHPESFGFEAFFVGDEIELVNANSLLCIQKSIVQSVRRINDHEISLMLKDKISSSVKDIDNVVVENTTWTPNVEISNCYFARIPTRGILISTRGKVLITQNIFFRTPMSGILIADDARSWYESGPVYDVMIKGNRFIECGSPVINIHPENSVHEGYVHRNIRIIGNHFLLKDKKAIYGKSVSGLTIENNLFVDQKEINYVEDYIETVNCEKITIKNNFVERSRTQ